MSFSATGVSDASQQLPGPRLWWHPPNYSSGILICGTGDVVRCKEKEA